jgi:hypothetical protein
MSFTNPNMKKLKESNLENKGDGKWIPPILTE